VKISLIVPAYNEEQSINEFLSRSVVALSKFEDFEIILIDDGSSDDTFGLIEAVATRENRVKCIKLSRNFGHQKAVLAGLSKASFGVVGIIDADLQDPPEILFEMAQKINEGYEVVYGQRIIREGETLVKKLTANIFYRVLNAITPINIPRNTGDFRVVSQRAANLVVEMKDTDPFLRGSFAFTGLKSYAFEYKRDERFAGVTKYSYRKMIKLAFDAVIGFSEMPLRIFMKFSQLAMMLAILLGAFALFKAVLSGAPSGWLSVFSAVFFFGSLNLFFLGWISRYLIATLNVVQDRPKYIIERAINI
jgi:glycosyltransferase involved in cell wall biosynthesis